MDFHGCKDAKRSRLHELLELGHSLIAEINRLSGMVPNDFVDPVNSKFKPLIVDFAYFGDASLVDKFIDTNEQGALLEDEFFFVFDKVIKRFGALFDTLSSFFCEIVELSEESYSSDSTSFCLSEADFQQRQLKAEILFVTGVILIIFNEKFPLPVKQRLFVAHYRSNPANNERFDLLIDLMKTAPSNMESLFQCIPINIQFAHAVVNSVRNDGLFADEHEISSENFLESHVTRTQRSVLFIALFFVPSILHSEFTTMRQIVDTYYFDNWVLSLHLGIIVNVVSSWECFKAANAALQQCITVNSAKKLAASNSAALRKLILPHSAKLSAVDFVQSRLLIATSNMHLRWIILHSFREHKRSKRANQLCDAVWTQLGLTSAEIFDILLQVSNFEYFFKEQYHEALSKKCVQFEELKRSACLHISQTAALFSSDLPLQKIKKNLKLQNWLQLVGKKLSELIVTEAGTPPLIEHLKKRIEQVSEIHDLSGNVAVDQYLQSVSRLLSEMLHCCALSEEFLSNVDALSEFSYGWGIIDQWSKEVEALVESNPLLVRSLFVKLSASISFTLAAVENPVRISAISLCYSRQLESRLRTIIQVVPRSLFTLLDRITGLLDSPHKCSIMKKDLRQFADPQRRLSLAECTFTISVLALSISTMELSWIGSLRIDPPGLLLDGIKRELVAKMLSYIYKGFISTPFQELNSLLRDLKHQFGRFHDAFIYMCEHMGINGAIVWQSELSRIVGSMLQKECNRFLKRGVVVDDQTGHEQPLGLPLPRMLENDGSVTPLGRLYNLIIKSSDPRSCCYIDSLQLWCEHKTRKPLLSSESFVLIQEALTPVALTSLDRIICFNIVKLINTFCELHSKFVTGPVLQSLLELDPIYEQNPIRRLKNFDTALSRITPLSSPFSITLSKIGQNQLLRKRILGAVKSDMTRNASSILTAVDNFQKNILRDLISKKEGCSELVTAELIALVEHCAVTNPLLKRYVKTECPISLASNILMILVAVASSASGNRRAESVDLTMFTVGVACLLIQFDAVRSFFKIVNMYFSSAAMSDQRKMVLSILPAVRMVANYCLTKPEELDMYLPGTTWDLT